MTKPESYMTFAFLEPWVPVREHAENLAAELQREAMPGHQLYKKVVHAIAQRTDCDDVLFEVDSASFAYAVVHLTWTGEPERDTRWPDTKIFATWQDWIENRMKPDRSKVDNA